MSSRIPARIAPADEVVAEIERRAVDYARAMGQAAMERYLRPVSVEFKEAGERNPVSEVDRFVEDFIRTAVGRDFPGHAVLGEEREQQNVIKSPFLWVVDPVDGTINFLSGYPFFAVSIGVLYDGQPLAAAVFVATTHRGGSGIYHARRGGGAYLESERLLVWPSPTPSPAKLAGLPGNFAVQFATRRPLRAAPSDVRVTGSIAAELCLTAAGTFQYVVFGAPRIWDVAAGVLLVTEAGGAVFAWEAPYQAWFPLTSFRSSPGDDAEPLRRWTRPLIAANPQLAMFVAANLRPRGRPAALLLQIARWIWRRLA